ncbi:MAG: serine/threonine-protein kinase, partial [Solirubrobacteraceae bacterium]
MRTIARGGMGVVYEVVCRRTGETVALKVIAPELVEHPDTRARFTHEAEISSTLDHPNIVRVRDTGEYAGTPYVAMDYINGRTLRQEILLHGPLQSARAVRILAQIADPLDYSHACGLAHRDVKAANVLLDDTDSADRVHLADFGISATLASTSGVTRTGCWVGSLDYVAPEVIQGDPAT